MKSLSELNAIKKQANDAEAARVASNGTIVVVGLATCGIAAGANPVFEELKKQVADKNVKNVTVKRTGCIGMCRLEPIVEVYSGDKEKVSYVKVKPEMVSEIVDKHLIGGEPVLEYTVGYAEK